MSRVNLKLEELGADVESLKDRIDYYFNLNRNPREGELDRLYDLLKEREVKLGQLHFLVKIIS